MATAISHLIEQINGENTLDSDALQRLFAT